MHWNHNFIKDGYANPNYHAELEALKVSPKQYAEEIFTFLIDKFEEEFLEKFRHEPFITKPMRGQPLTNDDYRDFISKYENYYLKMDKLKSFL